jgi:NAD(P)-dependent dehydrogenase (short-subunit alcohol dehydrogenase family)
MSLGHGHQLDDSATRASPSTATPRPGRLAGKVAIVTGAGSGIGRATATRFAEEGARVLLLSRTDETGEAAAAEANAGTGPGGAAAFRRTDVTVAAEVEAAVQEAVARWGQLDAIFNAAGISGRRFGDGPVADCTLDGWQTVLDANLTSVFLCCKYAVPALLAGGGGAIVNLASVLGLVGGDEHFATHAYAASKGGIIALTRAIASYYAPQGIRANVVAPGLIRTNMSRRAQSDPEILADLPRLQPLTGDFGLPEDVAEAVLYLCSDAARFVTGAVLPVDGGWTAR